MKISESELVEALGPDDAFDFEPTRPLLGSITFGHLLGTPLPPKVKFAAGTEMVDVRGPAPLTESERAFLRRLVARELDYSEALLQSTSDPDLAETEIDWQRELRAIDKKLT